MKAIVYSTLLVMFNFYSWAQTGTITNITVNNRADGSGLFDIRFDLSGQKSNYNISAEILFSGGSDYIPINKSYLQGDLEKVVPGTGKHIVWNGLGSFPDLYSDKTKIKIVATGISDSTIPTNGLVAYYPFNGNANDASGNGKDGLISGGVIPTTDRFGNQDAAFQFNGTDGHINTKISSGFTKNMTICVWINTTSQVSWAGVVFNRKNKATGLVFQSGGQKVSSYLSNASSWLPVDGKTIVTDGKWHLLTSVISDTHNMLYVDGVLDASISIPNGEIVLDGEFFIGQDTYSNSRHFKGKIDDVLIYNRALSTDEVQSIYTYGNQNSKETGLVAYYPLDGNANDFSGNANNGTINGGVTPTTDRKGNANSAMQFNGTNGFILVKSSDSFPSTAITTAFWFNRKGINATGLENYISKERSFSTYIYADATIVSQVWLGSPGQWTQWSAGSYKVPFDNKWTFYASTFDNSTKTVKVYINGELVNTLNETNANAIVRTSTNDLYIGRNGSSSVYFIKGELDDIRIYNRALSDFEIQSLYNESGQNSNQESFIDARNNKTYKTVKIGDQTWMAENLAYLPSVSPSSQGSATAPYYYVYGYQGTDVIAAKATENYKTYGVLYNWPAAMAGAASSSANPSKVQGVCPSGWHLPSDAEWKQMEVLLGMAQTQSDASDWRGTDQGTQLKASGGWNSNGNGNNSSGFSALPGGIRNYPNGPFNFIGSNGDWWTSTEGNSSSAVNRHLYYSNTKVYRSVRDKVYGFSVRCVRD